MPSEMREDLVSLVYLLRGKASLGTVVEDLNRPTPLNLKEAT
jgi:hypothetical protein